MAEKKQNTETKQLKTEDDTSEEIENDFEVSKADENVDDRDVEQRNGQQMSLPVQSMKHFSGTKEPSLKVLESRDTSLKGSDDLGNITYLQDDKVEKEENTGFMDWKLQVIGARTVLKTNFGKVKLPVPLSSRTDLSLKINDGKAYIISSDTCFEAQKGTADNWTFIPSVQLSTLDEIEELTLSDKKCLKSDSEKQADAKATCRSTETEECSFNTSANLRTENKFSTTHDRSIKMSSENYEGIQGNSAGRDSLRKEFDVHPIFETIVKHAREDQRTRHLFSDIEISFHEKGCNVVCVITSKRGASESVIQDVLDLQDQYGKRDLKFNEIKLLTYIAEAEQSGMVRALLGECEKHHDDFIYKVDTEKKRIQVAAKTQAEADTIAGLELKTGLDTKEILLIGPMRHIEYIEKFVIEVKKLYCSDIGTLDDVEGYKIRLTGLKSRVTSAFEKLQPVCKEYKIEDEDKLEYIASETQKKTATGELNLLILQKHEGRGFDLFGPDYQVRIMNSIIWKWLENFSTNTIHIRDSNTLSYFHGNAGKEFISRLRTTCEVILEDDAAASHDCWEKSHTFPSGHVISLSTRVQTNEKDTLDVKLQVSEDHSDPTHVYEAKTSERFPAILVPKFNNGESKEKEQMIIEIKQLLEFANKNSLTKVLVHLDEIGGWKFGKLVKQVLFSLKENLDKTLEAPTTFGLLMPSIEKYKIAEEIFVVAFPDLEFEDNHFQVDASETRLQIDVLKRDLLEAEADVVVYAVNTRLDLKCGAISASLLAKAGPQLQEDLLQHVQQRPKPKIKTWEFVCTEGHKLPYRCVFHGAIDKFEGLQSIKDMQNFIYRCLVKAEELKMKSVVFPAIGTGKCGYRVEDIAVALYEAAMLFEINHPVASLMEVSLLHPDDDTCGVLAREILVRREAETKLLRVGGVLLRGRLTDVDRIMADAMVVLWNIDSSKSVPVCDDPFLISAGTEVFKKFAKERKTGRTFTTTGGNFYPGLIVHIPFHDHEAKLESAFKDGIRTVEEARCKSCVFYFPRNSPLLKYKENMVKYLLKAIVEQPGKLLYVRSVVVAIQSSDKIFLDWFEKISETFIQAGQASKFSEARSMESDLSHDIKISGLEENVKRATDGLCAKIAQLQVKESKVPDVSTAPPPEQKISEIDRGISELSFKAESGERGYREDEDVCRKGDSNRSLESDEGKQSEIVSKEFTRDLPDVGQSLKSNKGQESKRAQERETHSAKENQEKLEKWEDYDILQKHEWSPSLLVHDEFDCCCIVVENIEEKETYYTLLKKLAKSQLPILLPNLIYPFETEQKALLICQTAEDADKLNGFTHKTNGYTYKKLCPQCLQMMEVQLSHQYLMDRIDAADVVELKTKLDEIGIVRTQESKQDLSVSVTIVTLSQMEVLTGVLKMFEVKVLNKTFSNDHNSLMKAKSGDRALKSSRRSAGSNNFNSYKEQTPERSLRDGDSLSADDFCILEQTRDVSETVWKAFNLLHCDNIDNLKKKNISLTFEKNVLIIWGCGNKADIEYIKKEVDKMKKLQMEEIKLGRPVSKQDSVQWCAQAKNALGKACCVYDEQTESFIAFGDSYEDISKVKHQLALKQGMIKQTGRRRNRNFDTSDPSGTAGKYTVPYSLSDRHGSPDFDWSFHAKQKQEYTTEEGIKVYVYIADILKLPVDCIVNAANDTLQHGGGVARVIEKGAGWKLTQEGTEYINNKGKVPVGEACMTTAGNLPYDCVIHAVGPRWNDFLPHTFKNVKDCETLLQNAIISSFNLADERNLKSIALPAISSAIFGVPQEMCAVQYAKAIIKYSSGSVSNAQRLQEIHFIDKNEQIIGLIQRTFRIMIQDKERTSYDIMSYVTDRSSLREPSSSYRSSRIVPEQTLKANEDIPLYIEAEDGCEVYSPNGSKVNLYEGNILEANKSRVSSVVCADDVRGQGKGGLAKDLLVKSKGFPYANEKSKAFRCESPKTGDVVLCPGRGTSFEHVLHAILWGSYPEKKDQKTVILNAYENIIKTANRRQLPSVAMPLLGTGSYKSISVEESAEAFMSSYIKFCDSGEKDSKLNIHLICKDSYGRTKVNEVIKSYLQRGREQSQGPDRKQSEDHHSDTDVQKGASEADHGNCVICMDTVSTPKTLPCGHVFCMDCIDEYHKSKKVCPTCGKVCGVLIGDQPEGKMSSFIYRTMHLPGYETCDTIEIKYYFPDGYQKTEHPQPGQWYKGITRTAYLPDNEDGQEILALLRVAFDRKLVFTIGHSRTTDREGVITWNDIHHKTNPTPGGNFGYPDPGYLARVKDELAAKGVTINDIPQRSSRKQSSGDRTVHYRH